MYKVINKINQFYGHKFSGCRIIIDGEKRIWDETSLGRSYPSMDCEEIVDE